MKTGILFDLDGTLWDTCKFTLKCYDVVCEKYNISKLTIDKVRKCMGLRREELPSIFFPDLDVSLAMKIINEGLVLTSKEIEKSDIYLYPYLNKVIPLLSKKYDLYIVSNSKNKKYIEDFFNISGLSEYFTSYISAGGLNIKKYEAINKIIKDNNISHAIYVGDTMRDLESSLKCNIPFVHAKYGFGDVDTKYSINSLNELDSVLEEVLKNEWRIL